METTTEFLTAFYSQKFSSFEEFYSKLKDFEKLTGSIYVITSSKLLPESHTSRGHLVYSSLTYGCYHWQLCQPTLPSKRTQRHSRSSCTSRLSLSALNGKLWITKYYMVHNHSPLPESIQIEPFIRRLQVQQAGKEDIVISDDVQVVLDDIVDQTPGGNLILGPNKDSPNKARNSSKPLERKIEAKNRLAARTKKARGLKLAPCLRRLAELASAGTGQEFHQHLDELEALAAIWKRGDVSNLGTTNLASSVQPIQPSTNDSIAIARAVENLFRKQKASDKPTLLSSNQGIQPPLVGINQTAPLSVFSSPSGPIVLKQALAAAPTTMMAGQQNMNFTVLPAPNVTPAGPQIATIPKDMVLADIGNGQYQLISSASLITSVSPSKSMAVTNAIGNPPLAGYVLQSAPGGQAVIASTGVTNFVPIAPKAPSNEPPAPFQPIPPPPPKSVRPPTPICKAKQLGRRVPVNNQSTNDQEVISISHVEDGNGGESSTRPWTSMIMEGSMCPYFLFIEDAKYYYSEEEDSWLPVEQKTMAVDTA